MPALISPEAAMAKLQSRLKTDWSKVLVGGVWDPVVKLRPQNLTGAALDRVWPETFRTAMAWDDWLAKAPAGASVIRQEARAKGVPHSLPIRLHVDTIDTAAHVVGEAWPARLERGRQRLDVLTSSFPQLGDPQQMLRDVDKFSDVDFDLACRAAHWFAANPASGKTAREVPVEGIGTKWLKGRMGVVRALAASLRIGRDDLGLVSGRPSRAQLTYLDPAHLAAGGRRHDVATAGDVDVVAYRPRVVVICENRDTAQRFPEIEDGIAVEGNEVSRSALAGFGWFRTAERIIYWGDMDADGLEILNGHRGADERVESLFMDLAAYQAWELYGVGHDHAGKPIGPRPPKVLAHLREGERALYEALCSEEWTRHRRIEQERISLGEAAALVRRGEARTGPRR